MISSEDRENNCNRDAMQASKTRKDEDAENGNVYSVASHEEVCFVLYCTAKYLGYSTLDAMQ